MSDFHTNDKEAFTKDLKESIAYNQKIARAKTDLRNRLPPRKLKKKELWEMNKTKWEIAKINSREAWRKFDTKSRGMGLMFVLFMGIMVIMGIAPMIASVIEEQTNKAKYREGLTTACLNEMFYSLNFRACEDIGVKPIGDNQK